ncbi:PREDICTED: uncharacterized protein LOC106110579 [Papilio polytes]|uniref:uncharacterized protein LOC106110579 n=1 Tax=Papilio polytes TaxID=76194 RepID=UPI0006767B82|nr:PREDICTED: uncharacterized protein LOC106110579 [Papilio polytes]
MSDTPDNKYQDMDIESVITEKTKIRRLSDEPIVVKKSAVRSIKFDQAPVETETDEKPMLLLNNDNKWEIYACGKTQDQLDLTVLAHQYLRNTALKPRSLNF